MSLAIGGSSASASGKPARGSQWVSVQDFGAMGDNVTDNAAAFQAAVDHLISIGGGTLFIPSAAGKYVVTKSIWIDESNIQVVGEGWSSGVIGSGWFPVFIFGIRRVQSGAAVDATYRPDVFGKLDTSAAYTTGQRWGYRTKGNSFAQFQAGPMMFGQEAPGSVGSSDNWTQTNKLTVEFCIEPPDGQQFTGSPSLLGLGYPAEGDPVFAFWITDPTTMRVCFRTSDVSPGPTIGGGNFRSFDISLAGADLPYKVAVQFDHDNAVCSAFLQIKGVRTQVPLINLWNMTNSGSYPYTPHTGLTFVQNDYYPFMIGNAGPTAAYGSQSTGVDLRIYGLRMSNALRYQTNGVGTPQTRVDAPGTAVNDNWAFFGSDANTICYLQCLDNPATAGRVITVLHGGAVTGSATTGLIMHITSQLFCTNNAVRDLQVCIQVFHGQAICLGSVYEFTAENVKTVGGSQGIGSFNVQENYYIYLRNCTLDGCDAPFYGFMQLIDAREISFTTSGRSTIRTVGCSDDWYNVFIGGASPTAECFYKAIGYGSGGEKSITNMIVDFEGYSVTRAGIYCEMHPYVVQTTLVLRTIGFGTLGPNASMIQLKDSDRPYPGYSNSCNLFVENLSAYSDFYGTAIDIDGPNWFGTVDSLAIRGNPFLHRQKWGTKSNVVLNDVKFTAPPCTFSWYVGAHVLDVRSPVDGQYTQWRCVGSGTYGTSNPPTWLGLHPFGISPNGMAAYVLNNIYVTATFS